MFYNHLPHSKPKNFITTKNAIMYRSESILSTSLPFTSTPAKWFANSTPLPRSIFGPETAINHISTPLLPHILYVPSISLSRFTSRNSISIASLSVAGYHPRRKAQFLYHQHYFDTRNVLSEKKYQQMALE
jgi:hypothetical protein